MNSYIRIWATCDCLFCLLRRLPTLSLCSMLTVPHGFKKSAMSSMSAANSEGRPGQKQGEEEAKASDKEETKESDNKEAAKGSDEE